MTEDILATSPRRSFLSRLAAGTAALGLTAFLPVTACAAEKTGAAGPDSTTKPADKDAEWPGSLKGKHKQLVDAFAFNEGFPLAFAFTFLLPYPATDASAASAVVVLRHEAFPMALTDAIWAKYKIGKAFNIMDPVTKAPAVRNFLYQAKPGSLVVDDMAIDKLMARGTTFGACNVALHVLSGKLASNAGVSAEAAAKEWTEGIIPGITIIPSGTWGVNRAQEAGCTYCAGG
jgi:intracellular sulfur oxidation DsrE/DsrF family protein